MPAQACEAASLAHKIVVLYPCSGSSKLVLPSLPRQSLIRFEELRALATFAVALGQIQERA